MSEPIQILVVSASLAEESRSKQLSQHAVDHLKGRSIQVRHESLQAYTILPYGMDGSEGLDELRAAFDEADGIIFSFPVYNYNMNASLKAAIEHFGFSLRDKVIGLIMSAAGQASYMTGQVVASGLSLDFRSWVVPRFVYATREAFDDNGVSDPEVAGRIDDLAWTVYEKAWQHRQTPPGA